MKRLLLYSFVVFCLGLTFNVNNVEAAFCLNKNFKSVHNYMSSSCGSNYYELNESQYKKFRKLGQKISSDLTEKNQTNKFFETIIPAYKKLYEKLLVVKAEPNKKIEDAKKTNVKQKNLNVASSIECYNPNTDKIEIWINYKICPGNRTLVGSGNKTLGSINDTNPKKKQPKQIIKNNEGNYACILKDINSDPDVIQKYKIVSSDSPLINSSTCLYKIYENDFPNTYQKYDVKHYDSIASYLTGYELMQISKKDGIFKLSGGLVELNKNFKLNADSRIITTSAVAEKETKKKKLEKTVDQKYIVKITHCQEMNYSTSQPLQYSRPYNYLVNKKCSSGFINEWVNNVRSIPHDFAIRLKYNEKYLNKKKTHFNICLNQSNGTLFFEDKNYTGECKKNNSISLQYDGDDYFFYSNKDVNYARKDDDKQIKVVQKQNIENQKTTNQEEFKPENKDVDNQAPIIEVAKNLKFESQTFKFKGRIKDKNKFYLTANGRPVKTDRKGRFEIEGFVIDPEQGEQLQLVAIDQWNNRSEQTVNIEVEFKQVVDARSYEKPNPNKVRVRNNDNKVGIIIGIEKYQTLNNVDAPYANRDANAFRAYANRALGIPNQNLKVLIDNKATRAELLKSLKIWLPQITRGQQKDVYIFFAGHGLASDDGKDLHILPQDGDPILLEDTAISRVEMFELINKVNPNSVTMFFDTCYSGQTRSEQMLVAGLRPVRIVANDQEIPNNYTIFTASDNDETSGSIEQAEHGIFSYYLMKGLEGNADLNKDKTLTNGELIAYLKNNVSQEAFSQNRQQEPMLSGNPDNILIRY